MRGQARGHLDIVLPTEIRGWCAPVAADLPVAKADIYVDNELLCVVSGVEYREDLSRAGIMEGFAGFSIETPRQVCDGRQHQVEARFHGTDIQLKGSPVSVTFESEDPQATDWVGKYSSYLVDSSCNWRELDRLRRDLASRRRKKVAIFASYSNKPDGCEFSDRIIAAIKRAGYYVVQVHACASSQGLSSWRPSSEADCYFVKHNIGYDFGSWLTGLALVNPRKNGFEEILLINDSNIGPIFPLEQFLDRDLERRCDLYGMIDSYEISHHIQSYAIRLSRNIIESGFIDDFASQYKFSTTKSDIVARGEVGLSDTATRLGFRVGSLYAFDEVRDEWLRRSHRYREDAIKFLKQAGFSSFSNAVDDVDQRFSNVQSEVLKGAPLNPTHFFWRVLYEEFSFPLLKKDLLFKNPANIPDWPLIPTVVINCGSMETSTLNAAFKKGGGRVPFLPTQRASEGQIPYGTPPSLALPTL